MNSSERTVSNVVAGSTVSSNVTSLFTAHHLFSIKLTHRNFLFWRTQVVLFLRGHDLIGFVDGSFPCLNAYLSAIEGASPRPNPDYDVWVRRDQSLLPMLLSSLSEEVMSLVVGGRTSKEV